MGCERERRGSYARRTETTRDETRQTIRETKTDAHEVQACEETIKACDAFLKSRGLYLGSNAMVTPAHKANMQVKPFTRRKSQAQLITKSLKAAILREIVMDARRRGVIKLAHTTTNDMPMSKWEDANE